MVFNRTTQSARARTTGSSETSPSDRPTERQTGTQADRLADRQREKKTGGQTERQTDRQAERCPYDRLNISDCFSCNGDQRPTTDRPGVSVS